MSEQLQKYHDELNKIYESLNNIHDSLRKDLLPTDFINIGSYTLEAKGALFSSIAELYKVINKY